MNSFLAFNNAVLLAQIFHFIFLNDLTIKVTYALVWYLIDNENKTDKLIEIKMHYFYFIFPIKLVEVKLHVHTV